jgi:threonine dehydratase
MFSDLRPIDIFAAAKRLGAVAVRTPLRRSPALSDRAGGEVYLKLECDQLTGSFKLRGAFNAIAAMSESVKARGVVTSSAGNHGLGVAWAAKHLHVNATVFVPRTAPMVKRTGIEKLGATIDARSKNYDEAMIRAKDYALELNRTYINPCLGNDLIAGQGTVALEIIEELPDLAMLIVPVGGGGLLAGSGCLLRRLAPHVRIAGAQSVNTSAMSRSIANGRLTHVDGAPTLADGLAGDIDESALEIGQKALDEIAVLDEASIADAIAFLAEHENLVVEGAGAVGVAAVLDERIKVRIPTVIVVTGRNIDPETYSGIVNREGRVGTASP